LPAFIDYRDHLAIFQVGTAEIAVDEMVARVKHRDSFDVIEDFGLELPIRMIAALLGVEAHNYSDMRKAADAVVQGMNGSKRHGWRGAAYWDAGPSTDFIRHYSGRVVANLATPSATHMRCQFQLVHPSDGMAGGGSGQCQLPDGKTVDAIFPAA
jgi:hypothetical protein